MFDKFLNDKCCMKVLSWILAHPNGYYNAPIVHIECGNPTMGEFMAALTILQGVEIINIDDTSEDLLIEFNKNSSISQLLTHFKDEFNDLAFRNMNVSPALSYLSSDSFRKEIDKQVIETVDAESILNACKDYETMEINNETDQNIYNLCEEMKKEGIYDDFIKFVEYQVENKK